MSCLSQLKKEIWKTSKKALKNWSNYVSIKLENKITQTSYN